MLIVDLLLKRLHRVMKKLPGWRGPNYNAFRRDFLTYKPEYGFSPEFFYNNFIQPLMKTATPEMHDYFSRLTDEQIADGLMSGIIQNKIEAMTIERYAMLN